jgi:hypothetical protein
MIRRMVLPGGSGVKRGGVAVARWLARHLIRSTRKRARTGWRIPNAEQNLQTRQTRRHQRSRVK